MSWALHLGQVSESGLLEEEELAAADHAAELVHMDVGAGHVDLGDDAAFHAVRGHEPLPRIVDAHPPANAVRSVAALAAFERRVLSMCSPLEGGVSRPTIGRIACILRQGGVLVPLESAVLYSYGRTTPRGGTLCVKVGSNRLFSC